MCAQRDLPACTLIKAWACGAWGAVIWDMDCTSTLLHPAKEVGLTSEMLIRCAHPHPWTAVLTVPQTRPHTSPCLILGTTLLFVVERNVGRSAEMWGGVLI